MSKRAFAGVAAATLVVTGTGGVAHATPQASGEQPTVTIKEKNTQVEAAQAALEEAKAVAAAAQAKVEQARKALDDAQVKLADAVRADLGASNKVAQAQKLVETREAELGQAQTAYEAAVRAEKAANAARENYEKAVAAEKALEAAQAKYDLAVRVEKNLNDAIAKHKAADEAEDAMNEAYAAHSKAVAAHEAADKAFDDYQAALEAEEDAEDAYADYAKAKELKDAADQAAEAYKTAIDLDTKATEAHDAWVNALKRIPEADLNELLKKREETKEAAFKAGDPVVLDAKVKELAKADQEADKKVTELNEKIAQLGDPTALVTKESLKPAQQEIVDQLGKLGPEKQQKEAELNTIKSQLETADGQDKQELLAKQKEYESAIEELTQQIEAQNVKMQQIEADIAKAITEAEKTQRMNELKEAREALPAAQALKQKTAADVDAQIKVYDAALAAAEEARKADNAYSTAASHALELADLKHKMIAAEEASQKAGTPEEKAAQAIEARKLAPSPLAPRWIVDLAGFSFIWCGKVAFFVSGLVGRFWGAYAP